MAATSACDAWAVGYYYNGTAQRTLIEHWNGKAWKVMPSPNRGVAADNNQLSGVTATSATNAWAVGYYDNGIAYRTLVLHWNGKAWKVQQSPNRGSSASFNVLDGVTATSATNAWAVGHFDNGTANRTLILHWNGTAWKVRRSPNLGSSTSGNVLDGVTATSSHDAWAVGYYHTPTIDRTLILHWNGTAWKVRKSPNPSAGQNLLEGVASVSSRNAWAVGYYFSGTTYQTLILHWNGKAWKVKPSPNRGASANGQLWGVAATSATNAWAAGYYWNGSAYRTLIERWNGKAWKAQPSPNLGSSASFNELYGVAATSSTNAWAVGNYQTPTARTLIERWNGTAWKG